MFSVMFKRQPPLDEPSAQWILDVYAWALTEFSADYFYQDARLVLPTNAFFPGRSSSPAEMAGRVFEQVAGYAGMQHWNWQLRDAYSCELEPVPSLPKDLAQSAGAVDVSMPLLPVVYQPEHIGNPEALIAGFAHSLAQYLGMTAREEPPGGVQNWPQTTEVLAIFMGFGLMFANSAFVFPPGGCRSCGVQNQQRQNALAQWDCTYALAVFTVLKNISYADVRPHLKKSLRGYFKRCVADIQARELDMQVLMALKGSRQRVLQ